ncbi:MAG: hypothetical protein ACM3VW_10595, partial [Bacteroidota bacterium]
MRGLRIKDPPQTANGDGNCTLSNIIGKNSAPALASCPPTQNTAPTARFWRTFTSQPSSAT